MEILKKKKQQQQLKIEVPYDLVNSILDTYPEKMKILILKVTFTLMFISSLYTIDKTWSQTKYP